MMAFLLLPSCSTATMWPKKLNNPYPLTSPVAEKVGMVRVKAFFNPFEDPILKEAAKEPVAFLGGVFAGLLRLDLNEDPLKEWVTKTVEAAGITREEISFEESKLDEDTPQEIEIQ